MADEPEGTPDEVQDSSNVETVAPDADSATGSQAQQIDWEKRHRDTQAELTRQSQARAELERRLSDPNEFQRLLAEKGYELGDEDELEDDDEFADPQERRIARLESQLAQRTQAEQQAQIEQQTNAFISGEIDRIMQAENVELDDEDIQLVGDTSLLVRDGQGRPDVEAAFKRLQDRDERQKQKWLESKKATAPASGPGAARTVDLDDPEERANWIDRMLG